MDKEVEKLSVLLDRWFHCEDGNQHLLTESQRVVIATHILDAGYLPVEELIKEIEKYQQKNTDRNLHFIFSPEEWQSIKAQED